MLGVPAPSFPASMSQQRQGSGRNKIGLNPGRSLMDWIKLTKDGVDLQGFKGRTKSVTLDELACHKTVNDCWIAIRGQVYNVSHYMEYHPGGVDELMKGAGKDATQLFEEVHKWVNFGSMLAKCYIGPLKYEAKLINTMKKVTNNKKQNTFLVPGIPPLVLLNSIPRYEWYEKGIHLMLSIYIKQPFHSSDIILDCNDRRILDVKVLLGEKYYRIHFELEHFIKEVRIESITDKKIELTLEKVEQNVKWNNLGTALDGHNVLNLNNERVLKFRDCEIVSIEEITYNTKLYKIELPSSCYFETPIGHHTKIRADVDGIEVERSYTVVLPSLHSTINNSKTGKSLHFLIKHYDNGALTPILNSLKKGNKISISDCIGTFERSQLKDKSKIYMIAAGTGFTPMIRLISHCLHNITCQMKLIFANKKEKDILWKNLIDDEVKKFPSQFHSTYILSEPNAEWTGLSGRINIEVLKNFVTQNPFSIETKTDTPQIIPTINSGELFFVCGPDEFTLSIKRMLLDIGVLDSAIFCFLG